MQGARATAAMFRARLAIILHDSGVTSVEYALVATLIAVVISGAVAVFGLSVSNLFGPIVAAL